MARTSAHRSSPTRSQCACARARGGLFGYLLTVAWWDFL